MSERQLKAVAAGLAVFMGFGVMPPPPIVTSWWLPQPIVPGPPYRPMADSSCLPGRTPPRPHPRAIWVRDPQTGKCSWSVKGRGR
jgi:hypothetical protein